MEIKKAASVGRDDARYFPLLRDFGDCDPGPGAVICQASRPTPVTADVTALPIRCI